MEKGDGSVEKKLPAFNTEAPRGAEGAAVERARDVPEGLVPPLPELPLRLSQNLPIEEVRVPSFRFESIVIKALEKTTGKDEQR